jgi:hypothetical protein
MSTGDLLNIEPVDLKFLCTLFSHFVLICSFFRGSLCLFLGFVLCCLILILHDHSLFQLSSRNRSRVLFNYQIRQIAMLLSRLFSCHPLFWCMIWLWYWFCQTYIHSWSVLESVGLIQPYKTDLQGDACPTFKPYLIKCVTLNTSLHVQDHISRAWSEWPGSTKLTSVGPTYHR